MPTIERNALNTGAKPIENDYQILQNASLFSADLDSNENQNITSKLGHNEDLLNLIGLGSKENNETFDNVTNNYSKDIFDLNDFLKNDNCTKIQQSSIGENLVEGYLFLFYKVFFMKLFIILISDFKQ